MKPLRKSSANERVTYCSILIAGHCLQRSEHVSPRYVICMAASSNTFFCFKRCLEYRLCCRLHLIQLIILIPVNGCNAKVTH